MKKDRIVIDFSKLLPPPVGTSDSNLKLQTSNLRQLATKEKTMKAILTKIGAVLGHVGCMTLPLVMMLFAFAVGVVQAFAATATVNGIDWSYVVADGKATIGSESEYDSAINPVTGGAIEVPNKLGGYQVTGIGDYAFYGCYKLTSVTMPNGVTGIGDYAFYYCSTLTSVTMPNSVTSIGEYAFYYCALASVTIPNSVTSIGDFAFAGCVGLASVTIPSSVTSIGDYAFADCAGLASVTIPASVTRLGDFAFCGCSSLAQILVDSENTAYASVDGVLFTKDKKTLLCCPEGKSGSIAIPLGVTSIGNDAFSFCSSLTSVTMPNSVTSIGDYAFAGCAGLASVTIPTSVTSIGEKAFYDCESLASVTIPASVTSIGENAFYDTPFYDNLPDGLVVLGSVAYKCKGSYPASVTIPSGVTGIGKEAFRDCGSLTSVAIPSSVTSIGEGAFYGCEALTSVTIPNGVTSIENYSFSDCTGLKSVTIGSSVTSIGIRAFSGCDALASVTIPSRVTSIGHWAFSGCSKLASVTIPAGVTSIESHTFWNCLALASVTMPDSVTSIGGEAFGSCCSLASVTIPDSVTSIGEYAFHYCDALKTIYVRSGDADRVKGLVDASDSGLGEVTYAIFVEYLDSDGKVKSTKKCSELPRTVSGMAITAALEDGEWYYVPAGERVGLTTMTVSGSVHLILGDGCVLSVSSGEYYNVAVQVADGSSLTVYGQGAGTGRFNVEGGYFCAGIGGGYGETCGAVTINGGIVMVTGGGDNYSPASRYGAGIGGGNGGGGGTVTVNGGAVIAVGTDGGAGIGAGADGASQGSLTIAGGMVASAGPDEASTTAKTRAGDGKVVLGGERCFLIMPSASYLVKFAAGEGATGSMSPVTWKRGKVYNLPACGFTTPAGKTFAGWVDEAKKTRYDGQVLVFDLAEAGKTVTLKAVWK